MSDETTEQRFVRIFGAIRPAIIGDMGWLDATSLLRLRIEAARLAVELTMFEIEGEETE